MEILRKSVHMSRQKNRAVSQITLDNDFNVPDIKPDIDKLILDRGEIRIEDVHPEKDRVSLKGFLTAGILYASAGPEAKIQGMEGKLPFEETLHMDGIEPGDNLKIDWEMEDLSVSAINSRKISVRSIITFTASAEEIYDEELSCGLEDAADVQIRTGEEEILKLMLNKKDTFRIREEVLLASNQANIYELLWKDMKLQGVEVRLMEDQISIKGELAVFALYEGENEAQVQWVSSAIPFAGTVDVSGCRAEMIGDIRVQAVSADLEAKPDYDGEERTMQADVVLKLDIRLYQEEKVQILRDLYSLSEQLKLLRQRVKLDTLLMKNYSKARFHERIPIRQEGLSILQICHSSGRVVVEETERIPEGLKVEGIVLVEILYITTNDRIPVCRAVGEVPFTHVLEVPGMDETCIHSLQAELEQITAAMVDSREAEIRVMIDFNLLVHRPLLCENILEIQEEPQNYEALQQLPGIVGYIVGNDDGLWDIAKKYYTTVEKICETNHLTGEQVKPGEKLLVIKSVGTGKMTG